jgi:hypothetical protein
MKKKTYKTPPPFSSTESLLFKRMQDVMEREIEQTPTNESRRGFLHAIFTGGIVLGVVGSGNPGYAAGCCEQNCLFCNGCMICVTDCQTGTSCETVAETCGNCQISCQAGSCQSCLYVCQGCQDSCQTSCEAFPASQIPEPCHTQCELCQVQQTGCVPGFQNS